MDTIAPIIPVIKGRQRECGDTFATIIQLADLLETALTGNIEFPQNADDLIIEIKRRVEESDE